MKRKRHWKHSGWFRSADVRYEYHERCRKTSGRGTGIYKYPAEVLQPCFRCAGRCTSDCCYSVFISFRWYSPGALCNWCSPLRTTLPIIMGQNIGTCITAMLSSIGATKNAKRAAIVHLYFNIVGTVTFMVVFYVLNGFYISLSLKKWQVLPASQ